MAEDNRDIKKARSLRTDGGDLCRDRGKCIPLELLSLSLSTQNWNTEIRIWKKFTFTKQFKSNKKHLKGLIATCL